MRGFEQPINIIFILFISMVVAGAIIAFSTDLIGGARDQIGELGPDEELSERIIETAALSDRAAAGIAQACYATGRRAAYIDDHVCAIVRTETPITDVSATFGSEGSLNGETFPIEAQGTGCTSVFVEYTLTADDGSGPDAGVRVSC